jgi:hypothetical protein
MQNRRRLDKSLKNQAKRDTGRTTLSGGVLKKEMTTDLFSHQAWLRLGVIWL